MPQKNVGNTLNGLESVLKCLEKSLNYYTVPINFLIFFEKNSLFR